MARRVVTVTNYREEDLIKRERTTMVYQGHQLDHINYFKNGAIVGYGDEKEEKFLVVLRAKDGYNYDEWK